ncbi:MAG: cytidine deaminase [Candidatus Neomarinimicrobiota bacterium]
MIENSMTNEELIKKAASVVKTRKTKNGLFGDVGCALISDNGKIYVGICADAGSNAICAEQNAIGAMITAGEYRIKKIVSVWKDSNNNIFVIAPCGNCRQFMLEVDAENAAAEIILDNEKTVLLKELLPYSDWWKKQE